jgi:hypothetical protein
MDPSISRFASQSTLRTLVDKNSSLSGSPESGYAPTVQTYDSKTWIDVGSLSPKILKELNRQYSDSAADQRSGTLAKGAAKIKAWARLSKLGIDIRLRRKISPEHDEVTDIRIVPDAVTSGLSRLDEKQPFLSELDAFQTQVPAELAGEVPELADTSSPPELPAARTDTNYECPSSTTNEERVFEELPKYEPRVVSPLMPSDSVQVLSTQPLSPVSSVAGTIAERLEDASQRHFNTATQATKLDDTIARPAPLESSEEPASEATRIDAFAPEPEVRRVTLTDPGQPRPELEDESKLSASLQEILAALQAQLDSSSNAPTKKGKSSREPQKRAVSRFHIAERRVHETETDVEPPSPSDEPTPSPRRARRRYTASKPKRKVSINTARESFEAGFDNALSNASLLRKQTLPKRPSASAGAEKIWASLLKMQEKILGPEHQLAYRGRADLARSRADGIDDFEALQKTRDLAAALLGATSSWAIAFAEDLALLEKLKGATPDTEDENEPATPSKKRLSAKRSISEPNIQFEEVSPSPALPTEGSPVLPRLVVSVPDVTEASPATATHDSALHSPMLDEVWNLRRPPHQPPTTLSALCGLLFSGIMNVMFRIMHWLQRTYGPEQPVPPGKVRVRWTCACGKQLHDDFIERQPGAARKLEAYLNRPRARAHTGGGHSPASPSSSQGDLSLSGSSIGAPPSAHTSWSSYGSQNNSFSGNNNNSKPPQTLQSVSIFALLSDNLPANIPKVHTLPTL